MILVLGKPGQLGNRLFVFANFIAFSAEHGVSVSDLAFDDYANSFAGPQYDLLCRHPRRYNVRPPTLLRRLLYSGAYRLVRASRAAMPGSVPHVNLADIWNDAQDLADPEFVELALRSRLLIAEGWLFHYSAGLKRHKATIRRFLTPIADIARGTDRLLMSLRQKAEVVIGIHVRRGDYSSFLNGRYFYDLEAYGRWIDQAQKLFPDQNVAFLIASDEGVRMAFDGNENIFHCAGEAVADTYSLSKCDYLIGPPSTFSMWASYYGDVPLCMVTRPDQRLDRASFRVVESQMDFPDVADLHPRRAS